MSRARVSWMAALVAVGGALVFAFARMETGGTPDPAPPMGVPDGYSVERVRVGDRDLWCVSRYSGGLWCDGTREAS